VHEADTVFASWFTYDVNGRGLWLVMTAEMTAQNTYSGTLYRTQGPPFNAEPFDPSKVVRTEVGTGTLILADADNGDFVYTVNGVAQAKFITREIFGPMPTCIFGAQSNPASATNYQDLWWATSEPGWGINLSHEGDTIFATWFTYDLDGAPMWLALTATKAGPGVYAGDLYRTSGARFDTFDPANVSLVKVGTASFTFADGNNAAFDYTVQYAPLPEAVHQVKTITREVLDAPGTVCR
jgi:hypothetical protein